MLELFSETEFLSDLWAGCRTHNRPKNWCPGQTGSVNHKSDVVIKPLTKCYIHFEPKIVSVEVFMITDFEYQI